MKKILLILLLSSFIAHAQTWQWARGTNGASMESWPVATDPSGNVFVAGYNCSGDFGIAQPAIFGSYAVPFSSDTGGGHQTIICKYDSNGNFLWARATQNGNTGPLSIATDHDGNSILFGQVFSPRATIDSFTFTNTTYPESQYFLAKFDSSGNILWVVNTGNVHSVGIGAIATDAAGNIYLTTNFHAPTVFVRPYTLTNADTSGFTDDILVAKYDPSGNIVWAARAGGSGADGAFGLTVTPAGAIYIAGVFSSPTITFGPSTISDEGGIDGNPFIAEFNSSGTPIWASGSGGAGGELAMAVASDASNNVYLTGGFRDNTIAFSGTAITNPYPADYTVLYLVKFNPSNNVSWYKTIGDPTGGFATGSSVSVSPCGSVWVSGPFTDHLDSAGFATGELNIDGRILPVPAESRDPVFIAGFNTAGAYVASAALQSGSDDQIDIACDALGNLYIGADYSYSPFLVGDDTLADISAGDAEEWQYVAKYTFVNVANSDTFYSRQDTAVCTYASVLLYAPPGYSRYLWGNGSTGPTLPIDAPGIYPVAASGVCGVNLDSITVTDNAALCPCEAAVPTAFTPNDDGKDDYFQPLFMPGCNISNYSFSVFNRWGQLVFNSQNPAAKWDGNFWYTHADVGTYMYLLKYTSGPNNTPHTQKGDVTLIR